MYICLEGIDGSGKTTQIKLLGEWLESYGLETLKINEPTNQPIGFLIRKMLKDPKASSPDFQRTLGLLFAADRMILMEKISEAEQNGRIVISDRSFFSSLAYQDDFKWVEMINQHVRIPDMVILLDLDVEKAISRCDGNDHFENAKFLENVRKNYLALADKYHFFVINGNNGVRKIHEDLKKIISPKIGRCF
jgi:dTMP kinase